MAVAVGARHKKKEHAPESSIWGATSPHLNSDYTAHLQLGTKLLTWFCRLLFCCVFLQGPDTDAQARKQIREVALEWPHKPVEVVILNYKKDGTPFWNMLNIVPILDDVGVVKVFLGTQVDVTDIVKLVEHNAAYSDENVVGVKRNRFNTLFSLPLKERPQGPYARLSTCVADGHD